MLITFAYVLYLLSVLVTIFSPIDGSVYVSGALAMLGMLFVGLSVIHDELKKITKELTILNRDNSRKD